MTTDERLQALERRCRGLTAVVMILAAGLGIAVISGADKGNVEKVVRAEKVEVVDREGTVRVVLGPQDEGYGVVVNDDTGQFRATMTDAPAGAAIQLRKGSGAIKLLVTRQLGPFTPGASIALGDGRGQQGAVIAADEGGPKVRLDDEKGKAVFSAPGP